MKLTNEELIKLALQGKLPAKPDNRKNKTRNNNSQSVTRFVEELQIKPGNNKVPTFVLFYLYREVWSPSSNKVSKVDFFRSLGQHLAPLRTPLQRYYLVDAECEQRLGINTKTFEDKAKFYVKNYSKKTKKAQEEV